MQNQSGGGFWIEESKAALDNFIEAVDSNLWPGMEPKEDSRGHSTDENMESVQVVLQETVPRQGGSKTSTFVGYR